MARLQFNAAGISFRVKSNPELAQARPSGIAEIRLEPDNKFAKHERGAFGLFVNDMHVGYVPDNARDVQDEIIRILDSGETPLIEVESYSYRDGTGFNDNHAGVLGSVKLALCTEGDGSLSVKDGKVYQRITSLLDSFKPDGIDFLMRWGINKFRSYEEYKQYMAESAAAGTRMHAALERYFTDGGIDADNLPDSFGEFLSWYEVEPISTEERLYDEELMLSGQYDLLATVRDIKSGDSFVAVLDWKSSRAVRTSHKIQASFYAYLKGMQTPSVHAMVVAFGGAPDIWIGSPETATTGYDIVRNIVAANNLVASM